MSNLDNVVVELNVFNFRILIFGVLRFAFIVMLTLCCACQDLKDGFICHNCFVYLKHEVQVTSNSVLEKMIIRQPDCDTVTCSNVPSTSQQTFVDSSPQCTSTPYWPTKLCRQTDLAGLVADAVKKSCYKLAFRLLLSHRGSARKALSSVVKATVSKEVKQFAKSKLASSSFPLLNSASAIENFS